jgi:soluble lytic murein transglycosylase
LAQEGASMSFFRKKRVFAVLLLLFLLLLFYNTHWVGRLLYPVEYKKDIMVSAQNFSIDPLFVASIIRVESNYQPHLVSRKGAVGLMQIMPATAEWIIRTADYSTETLDHLDRPDVNIEVGSWYLHSLTKQLSPYFNGHNKTDRIAVISAAYNAGPGNVNKWLQADTWDGRFETLAHIPFGETRHYVQRVVYYYNKYVQYYAEDGF